MTLSDDPPEWTCVLRAHTRQPIAEASLVLTAVGIENQIDNEDRYWRLLTPSRLEAAARRQLESYGRENVLVSTPTVLTIASGWRGVIGYLLAIWSVPALAGFGIFDVAWRVAGRMDAGLVAAGEWWRLVTALTLHADLAHLVSNSFFGAVFGLLAGRFLGSGMAWLLILAGGAMGNAVNAWLRPDGFLSIGASTATFAAVGLLAAYVWRRGYFQGGGLRRGLAPIFAAIAFLAFMGFGGVQTDVLAHVAGLICGIVLGVLAATFDPRRLGKSGQVICGVATVGILVGAWIAAAGA